MDMYDIVPLVGFNVVIAIFLYTAWPMRSASYAKTFGASRSGNDPTDDDHGRSRM